MKNKIKRIINLIILIVLAIGLFIFTKSIPNFLIGKEENNNNAFTQTIEKKEEELQAMPSGVAFEVNTGNLKHYEYNDGEYWRVIAPSVASQIYCASKGSTLSGKGQSYEELVSIVNSVKGKISHKSCANPGTIISRPYYKVSSQRPATAAEAFILTWPGMEDTDWNEWTPYKQEAIWKTPTLSSNKKAPVNTSNGMQADILAVQALYYQKFIDQINKNGGTINPQNTTNESEVKKNVDQKTKEYTVGPFTMNYVNGNYGLVFGGISDMYIVGENNSRIEIDTFILEQVDPKTGAKTEVEVTPAYFEVIGKNHFIDTDKEADQVTPSQRYPIPGQKFYVKYKSTTDEQINNIHVEFKWMEAEATLTYYDAVKYKTVVSCTHTEHCHGGHWCSKHKKDHGTCRRMLL